MAQSKAIRVPFTYGGDPDAYCAECKLPCSLEEMSVDCHRRFFLHGSVNCSYFVYGFCFLIDRPGCVFDNGGRHDEYWLHLLNAYFHKGEDAGNDEYRRQRAEALRLVDEQLASHTVSLCRYLEEYYQQIMASGGGLAEEMQSRLDEAYLSLLKGISRKTD